MGSINEGEQMLNTIFTWVLLSAFGFIGYNYGVRSFVVLPPLNIFAVAGIAACGMLLLVVFGKKK